MKKNINTDKCFSDSTEKYSVIDLFSGAGGMSLGFEWAGFENIFAVEYDKNAAETYNKNFPENKILIDDIKNIDENKVRELIQSREVDLIIGGPPCQGFSIAGNIGRKFIDDERNYLFLEFVRFVSLIKPRIFVMENVQRLVTHNKGKTIKEIVNEFEKLGYRVKYEVLNAVDYEVPQNRRRVFVVGCRDEEEFNFPEKKSKLKTVGESIGNLPKLKSGETSDIEDHNSMNHTKQMLEKMKFVREGGNREDIPSSIRPKSGDARKYIRYDRNQPSVTITGDMRKVFHYEQNRALTNRELARLQTFPDNFIFAGNSISIQQQIGNAVPPKLAYYLALEIRNTLEANNE